jgi:hypothetical protein
MNNPTITARPAAGPLTCKGQPDRGLATIPPIMAVNRPTEAALFMGTPDAIATPIERGNATKKTTKEASKSSFQVLPSLSALIEEALGVLGFKQYPLDFYS